MLKKSTLFEIILGLHFFVRLFDNKLIYGNINKFDFRTLVIGKEACLLNSNYNNIFQNMKLE